MSKKTLVNLLLGIVAVILLTFYDDARKLIPSTDSLVSSTSTYQVVKVVDGDTITIAKDGKNQSVRLIGVDTPETVDPRRPVECFGEAAAQEMQRLVAGKQVRLESDRSQGETDQYGRLLAYVYADDILVNKHLIAEGFGQEYTHIRPYAYQKEFRAAESSARAQEKGLWAHGMCE